MPAGIRKDSSSGNHNRATLALGTEAQAEMALGEAAVDAGAAPHKPRQGIDKGQLVTPATASSSRPASLPSTCAPTSSTTIEPPTSPNVPRTCARPSTRWRTWRPATPRKRTQEVFQRLTEANRDEYRDWRFSDLKDVPEEYGAAPYKSDGIMVVSRDRVREALAERDSE